MGVTRAVFTPDGKMFCFLNPDGVDVYSMGDGKELFAQRVKGAETWDHIKDALMGVAAAHVTDFVGELVPGFADEYRNIVRPPLR